MRKLLLGAPVFVALVLGATGCDKVAKLAAKKAADAAGSAVSSVDAVDKVEAAEAKKPSSEEEKDRAIGQKLNDYIECINNFSPAISRSHERYLSWIDVKKGLTGKERLVYGLYPVNKGASDRCKKALSSAKAKQPPMPAMEKAALAYEAALDAAFSKIEEAHTYYETDRYKGDSFAKGKELHGPLLKAFETFEKADGELRTELSKLKDGMAERELERMAASGKDLAYYQAALMISAKHLVRIGDDGGEAAPLEKGISEFAGATDAMDTYAKAHSKESGALMSYSSFLRAAREFEKSGRAMVEFRKGKKMSSGEKMLVNNGNGGMVKGHPEQFIEAFNKLVQSSNSLH